MLNDLNALLVDPDDDLRLRGGWLMPIPIQEIEQTATAILTELERAIYGKRPVLELAVTALLADGHVLIEDVPGTAKTLLAKALARTLGGVFRRLQCTPDLLPSDITGTNIYNQKTGDFEFRAGPIAANILLADEINRATPRAQAALLECMAERQATIDGHSYRMYRPFFVIATQNPIEHEGTFALPEAQLDRFLMRLSIGYPSFAAEDAMLTRGERHDPLDDVGEVLEPAQLVALQQAVREVHVAPEVRAYIVHLVAATRGAKEFVLGAGPRATTGLYRASQALAAMAGRNYVLPDDVKRLCPAILYHRVVLSAESRLARRTTAKAVDEVLALVPAPVPVGPIRGFV